MDTSRGVSEGRAVRLPEGLAQLPPGAGVAVLLESVDRSTVAAEQLLDLVRARARLLAHVQAELFADIVEAARGVDAAEGSLSRRDPVPWENAEFIGWALCYSGAYGAHQLALAQQLVQRLPMVHQALREGRLDYGRAAAFADALSEVDDEVARQIAQRLLDKGAERIPLSALREKLRYHIDRRDPESKRRRYRKRVSERDVWLREKDDGTAILAGSHLPPHRAGAAFDRVDRLARAARSDGDARTLSQLRADAMLDLLTGLPFQLAPSVDPLTAEADAEHEAPSGEPRPPREPMRRFTREDAQKTTDNRADAEHQPPPDPPTDRIDLYDYDRYCLTDADRWWLDQTRAGGADQRPRYADLVPDQVLPGDRCAACGGPIPAGATGVVEMQVKLTTLVGLDDDPALIPGFGPILADIARHHAHDSVSNPTWRWSVFAEDGDLLHHGHTRRRPSAGTPAAESRFPTGNLDPGQRCTCSRVQTAHRRNVIEIQLNPQTLAALLRNPALAPEWAEVVTDITRQVAIDAVANPPGKWSQADEYGQLLDHGHTGRFANAVEDAFVRARDRSCRAPTCHTPASRTELDHRIEHDKGGPSHRGNLDARCKRHHVIRHRKGMTTERCGTALTLTLPNGATFTVTLDKDVILTNE